jgi:hypothetical protein
MGGVRWLRGAVAALSAALLGLVLVGVLATRLDTPPVATTRPDQQAQPPAPATAALAPPRAPLTGMVLAEGVRLDHPAVAVKVSDVPAAHPQVGVDRADIVFVEPVGVSYTRLAAVLHSDVPEAVGPVRSVRPPDAPLLGPLGAVFGNTMGAEWVMTYVDAVAHLDNLGTLRVLGSGAYQPDPRRPAPDHMLARPQVLLELSELNSPPRPYFSYALPGELSSAEQAGTPGAAVEVSYGPDWEVRWSYDPGTRRYLREQPWGPHTVADGAQVSAANVLVLEVGSTARKIGDGAGAPVPVLELVDGSGRFVALSRGRSVTGTWTKAGVNERFELRTAAGAELRLVPGNTWVELPEPGAAVVASGAGAS